MVERIRKIETALGNPLKQLYSSEVTCYEKLRKTLVTAKPLLEGHQLCKEDIKIKVAVPKGIDGLFLDSIIGKRLKRNVEIDESLLYEFLE